MAYINPMKSSSRYSRHWAVASWGDNLATDLSWAKSPRFRRQWCPAWSTATRVSIMNKTCEKSISGSMNLRGRFPPNLSFLSFVSPETRETALLELSKMREKVEQLAPMLWHSFGTIAVLLQEIVGVYHAIDPATLTPNQVMITSLFWLSFLISVKSSL